MTDSLLALTNAAAGSAGDEAVRAACRAWTDRGVDVDLERSLEDGGLERALDRREGRPVVVMGGDGSLHVVVGTLDRRGELGEAVLGLVPLGTGNDLARGLGLPLDPAQAAAVVLDGAPRPLDLLLDSAGWPPVVNAVNLGIGAAASERAAPYKRRLGPAGYAVGAVASGLLERGWHLRVEVDGRVVAGGHRRVLHVVIANNGPTVGGGTPAVPDAAPGDGQADVIVSYAVGPLSRLVYALRLRDGGHVERADVVTARGTRVSVAGGAYPWNADGEIGRPRWDGSWTVRHHAWRLVLPRRR